MSDSRLILLVEPSSADAISLETAFRKQHLPHPVRVLRNTYELRSYLNGAGIYADRVLFPLPSLLLLDFSEPMTAINTVEWLEQQGYLSRFAVIGIGRFASPNTLRLAFDLGLNGYFDKPSEFERLAEVISELQWVDDWGFKLGDAADTHLLTREQFYRKGAA